MPNSGRGNPAVSSLKMWREGLAHTTNQVVHKHTADYGDDGSDHLQGLIHGGKTGNY